MVLDAVRVIRYRCGDYFPCPNRTYAKRATAPMIIGRITRRPKATQILLDRLVHVVFASADQPDWLTLVSNEFTTITPININTIIETKVPTMALNVDLFLLCSLWKVLYVFFIKSYPMIYVD